MRHSEDYEDAPYSKFQVMAVTKHFAYHDGFLRTTEIGEAKLEAETLEILYEQMAKYLISVQDLKDWDTGQHRQREKIDVDFGMIFETIGEDDFDMNTLKDSKTWQAYLERLRLAKEVEDKRIAETVHAKNQKIIEDEKALLASLKMKYD